MRCGAARDLAALRRHIDGQWSLDQKALGRAAATGARGSARHGSARSGGTQSVGQHGADPGETICRFALCLPAIRWPIYRCVAEQCPDSQIRPYGESADCGTLEQKALTKPSRHLIAAKTSDLTGAESPARFQHLRYAFSSTVSRTQRDIRPGTARLHRSEHRRLREPFSPIRTKKGTESPTPNSARFTV